METFDFCCLYSKTFLNISNILLMESFSYGYCHFRDGGVTRVDSHTMGRSCAMMAKDLRGRRGSAWEGACIKDRTIGMTAAGAQCPCLTPNAERTAILTSTATPFHCLPEPYNPLLVHVPAESGNKSYNGWTRGRRQQGLGSVSLEIQRAVRRRGSGTMSADL